MALNDTRNAMLEAEHKSTSKKHLKKIHTELHNSRSSEESKRVHSGLQTLLLSVTDYG